MKTKEMTCVVCPVGCSLTVHIAEDGAIADVTGNTCPRGKLYAIQEYTHPERTLTTTVRLEGAQGSVRMLPVKTDHPIPRDKLLEAMDALRDFVVAAPVAAGEILIRDFMETGVHLVSCKTVK